MKRKFWQFSLMLVCSIILFRCKPNDEVPYAGNASVQGKLQYTDAVSGLLIDLPKGQVFNVFVNNTPSPYVTDTTKVAGYYSYYAPAIGSYQFTFKYLDTILQFDSTLVRKVDLDTLRKSEYDTVGYAASSTQALVKDQVANKAINLLPTITGIRIKATDSLGNILPNVSLCVYDNLNFYNQNFPNCGGSIKYISTNHLGVALITGLSPNSTYYINAQVMIGTYLASNHYAVTAQTFVTNGKGTINPLTVILK
jgi:hypothetical protein